jgi:hypothetical protein
MDPQRPMTVKARADELKLSLEALATVGKAKPSIRPLSESLAEWRDKPPAASPELQRSHATHALAQSQLGDSDDR